MHERERTIAKVGNFGAVDDSFNDEALCVNFDVNVGGVVTTWDKSCEQLLGYSSSEMLNQSIAVLLPWESRLPGDSDRLVHTARSNKTYVTQGWIVRRSGERLWCSIDFLNENQSPSISVRLTDMVERFLASERFLCWQNSRAEYYTQAILMLGPTGNIVRWDPRARDLFARDAEQALGKRMMDFCEREHTSAAREECNLALAAKSGMSEFIGLCTANAGEPQLIFFRIRRLKTPDTGHVAGFYVIATRLSACTSTSTSIATGH